MANNEQRQDFAELLDEDREGLLDEVRRLIDERIGEALSFERMKREHDAEADILERLSALEERVARLEHLARNSPALVDARPEGESDPEPAPQDSPGPEMPEAVVLVLDVLRYRLKPGWPVYADELESTVRSLIREKEERERELAELRPRDTLTKEAPQDSPGPEMPEAVAWHRAGVTLIGSRRPRLGYGRPWEPFYHESTVRNLIERIHRYEKASGFRDRDQMQARIERQAEEITRLHEKVRSLIREKEKAERERDYWKLNFDRELDGNRAQRNKLQPLIDGGERLTMFGLVDAVIERIRELEARVGRAERERDEEREDRRDADRMRVQAIRERDRVKEENALLHNDVDALERANDLLASRPVVTEEPEGELPNAILGAAADLRRAHYHHAAENLVATVRNLIEQKEKAERAFDRPKRATSTKAPQDSPGPEGTVWSTCEHCGNEAPYDDEMRCTVCCQHRKPHGMREEKTMRKPPGQRFLETGAYRHIMAEVNDLRARIRELEEESAHLRKMRDEACQAWDQHHKRADRLEAERNHHLCTEHVKVEVTEEGEAESVEDPDLCPKCGAHWSVPGHYFGCPVVDPEPAESVEGEVIAGFRIVSDPNIPAGEIHFRTQKGGRPVVHKITGITLWTPTPGGDDAEE